MVVTVETKQAYWAELASAAGALAANLVKMLRSPGNLAGNAIDGGEFWGDGFMIVASPELPVRDDPARLEPVDTYLAQNLLVNLAAEFPEFAGIGDWRSVARDQITPEMIRILRLVTHRRTFSENCEVSQSWRANECTAEAKDALKAFLALYAAGSGTLRFYEGYLKKSIPPLGLTSTTADIQRFIDHGCGKLGISPGGRKAYFRALRAFFNWAYSPASALGMTPGDNPITWVKPRRVSRSSCRRRMKNRLARS